MIELNRIYNENCMITMSKMDNKSIDLILTDPPYGVGIKYDNYNDTEENWFDLMSNVLPEMIRVAKMVIMPVCRIGRLQWIYSNYPPDWLICWYKGSGGHRSYIGFNDWEPHLVYGKYLKQQYMHDYFHTKGSPPKNTYGHPCPKPLAWAYWIIKNVARDNTITIYDSFLGSGTVAYAARELRHNYIGSEISKKYCSIAENRMSQMMLL